MAPHRPYCEIPVARPYVPRPGDPGPPAWGLTGNWAAEVADAKRQHLAALAAERAVPERRHRAPEAAMRVLRAVLTWAGKAAGGKAC